MNSHPIASKTLLLVVSACACGTLFAHPRPENTKGWISSVEEVEKLGKNTKSVAIDIKTGGDRSLVDAVVKRCPNLRELKIYSFPHEVHPSIFESLGRLKMLNSLEVSGDARLSERDFELIGRMTHLRHLKFSLP